jgi:hypothetical protein
MLPIYFIATETVQNGLQVRSRRDVAENIPGRLKIV